jgi:hypothetical protein
MSRLIKFKYINDSSIITIGDLLFYALDDTILVSQDNTTIWSDNDTFQCKPYAWRTDNDLYLLCQYYKFKITLVELQDLLVKLKTNSTLLMRQYCDDIHELTNTLMTFNNSKDRINRCLNTLKLNINRDES